MNCHIELGTIIHMSIKVHDTAGLTIFEVAD